MNESDPFSDPYPDRDDIDHDDVDHIVAAWRRERPDLDVSPLEVFSRISRLARHLDIARRTSFSHHSLDAGEFDVLAALRRSGAPYAMTPGQLAANTLVSTGTITNRLDRLEEAQLISRAPDISDRRVVSVQLTPFGCERVDATLTELLLRERAILASLGLQQQQQLADLLRSLTQGFDIT